MKIVRYVPVLLVLFCITLTAGPLVVTQEGVIGQTTVYKASFAGSGATSVGTVAISDSNSQTGGSPGVFSGFDLDFLWLDVDGVFATAGDRIYAASYAFTTGTIRPTADPNYQPTIGRPGPTFGSSAADTIDPALSTLGVLDGAYPVAFNTDNVFGWLTFGDGGVLKATFFPSVALNANSALFFGEVGTGLGEQLRANVELVPEPGSWAALLLGLGGLSYAVSRRRKV